MRHAIALTLSLIALAAPGVASAQDHDGQIWTTANADFELQGGITLGAHATVRLSDDAGGVSEMQFGTDLEVEIGEDIELGAGYSNVPRYDGGDLATREHRIRQQVSGDLGTILGGTVNGRLRLEQRWRDDGDDTMLRLRARLLWTRPIGGGGLDVRLGHESFYHVNDTDWGGEARYNRMRNEIGLRKRLGTGVTGAIGYLNQLDLNGAERDEMAHVLTLGATFDF